MSKRKALLSPPIPPSEITPEHVYINRRQFLGGAGALSLAALLAACAPGGGSFPTDSGTPFPTATGESDEAITPYAAITNYNNYYEFTVDKERVAVLAENFRISPWQVEVGGLVNNPRTFGLEDLLRMFDQEERIYRLRCVEGWSMVIPWMGFPLARLLEEVEPTGDARYVMFTTLLDQEQMPGTRSSFYPWPYTEGLRLDEVMHDLTILATGLYGKELTPQNGAPIRLVVPWKYGFNSIKAIISIELVAEQPPTFWNLIAPNEYGFYSNVNPEVDHPRWSQASERRIGESGRRRTLLFNGYEEDVAHLYAGMDLTVNY